MHCGTYVQYLLLIYHENPACVVKFEARVPRKSREITCISVRGAIAAILALNFVTESGFPVVK
jgi:Ni,Fe-hydrogenase III component G